MEVHQLTHSDGSPFAVYCNHHIPIRDFLKAANEYWSGEAFDEELTRYEYGIIYKNGSVRLNCLPSNPAATPITVSYWEEPMPNQERQYEQRKARKTKRRVRKSKS